MKPGQLVAPESNVLRQLTFLSDALYEDESTEQAIDDLYLQDEFSWYVQDAALDMIATGTCDEPTEGMVTVAELLIEKLTAICIKHAPEGYTFGERRGALGFWTAEEMDNN